MMVLARTCLALLLLVVVELSANAQPVVAIKSHDGKFLSANGVRLTADQDEIGNQEKFIITPDATGKVSLKSQNGYVKMVKDGAGNGTVTCNEATVGAQELFTLEVKRDGRCTLKNVNDLFLKALGSGQVSGDPGSPGPQENFTLILLRP